MMGVFVSLKAVNVKGKNGDFEVLVNWRLTEMEKLQLAEEKMAFQVTETGERALGGKGPESWALVLATAQSCSVGLDLEIVLFAKASLSLCSYSTKYYHHSLCFSFT